MEDRLDFRLQINLGYRLRDPIGNGRHPEHPYAFPASLGDFHCFDRGRKVTPGRHAIPNPVQVLIVVLLELSDRHVSSGSLTFAFPVLTLHILCAISVTLTTTAYSPQQLTVVWKQSLQSDS